MTLKSKSTQKSYSITVTRVNVIRYFPPLNIILYVSFVLLKTILLHCEKKNYIKK